MHQPLCVGCLEDEVVEKLMVEPAVTCPVASSCSSTMARSALCTDCRSKFLQGISPVKLAPRRWVVWWLPAKLVQHQIPPKLVIICCRPAFASQYAITQMILPVQLCYDIPLSTSICWIADLTLVRDASQKPCSPGSLVDHLKPARGIEDNGEAYNKTIQLLIPLREANSPAKVLWGTSHKSGDYPKSVVRYRIETRWLAMKYNRQGMAETRVHDDFHACAFGCRQLGDSCSNHRCFVIR